MSIFRKVKKANGRRRIYLFGIKIFSYKKANKAINIEQKPVVIKHPSVIPATGVKKGVIYTCIAGEYDDLIQHTCINHNYDYVCFTDNNDMIEKKQIGVWQILPLVFNKLDNIKNARWHKVHPHVLFPNYEKSIWIDSNSDILTSKLFQLIENNVSKPLLVPLHFSRDCIYDECQACIMCEKESEQNANAMQAFLKSHNMPENYGLNETNILIRNHLNPQIIAIMEQWWDFIEKYSKRDQLSFSYVLYKNDITVPSISFENARLDFYNFDFVLHKSDKKEK